MKLLLKTKKTISTAWWIDNLIIAVGYFALSALVLKLPQSQLGSPVWPPAGLAVGALLARGRSRWIGIFLGAALNSFLTSKVPFLFAICAGIVPTIGSLISTTLVLNFNKTNDLFGYVKYFVLFCITAIFSGTVLQALLGSLIVVLAGLIPWNIYWSVTWGWWVGDAIGVLLFAPLICAWWNKQSSIKFNNNPDNKFNKKELILCLLILAITFYLVLIENQPIEYFLLPPLLWSAFRFGTKITTLIGSPSG